MPKIEKKPDESAHEQFVKELFALYSQNSFGSLSKRELDIFLFHWFRKLGEISGADSWSIAKYVRDAIRSFLMSNDCVTDLSFSSDVVKMSLDGYWLLQSKYNNENLGKLKRDDFINTLKQLPAKIAGGVLKKVVGEFAEREFSSLLGEVVEFAKKEIKKNSNEE